jgi:polyisoprenoid-binding protein YceI
MNWEIDSAHSHVSFAIRIMGVTTTKGRFKVLHGRLNINEQNPANSWVEARVEAASIDTGNRLRDTHLRSAAFFDVKKYSSINFASTHVEQVSGQHYRVSGNLTLHGVTRSISFDVYYHVQSSMLNQHTSFTALATINRLDFGVGQGMAVRFAASSMVTIEIDLEVVQQSINLQDAVTSNRRDK